MTRRFVAIIAIGTLLGACSSPDATDVGARSRLGPAEGSEAKETDKKPKGALKKAERIAKKAGVPGGSAQGGSKAVGRPPAGGGGGASSEIDPSLARRSAVVEDAASDATKQGVTPDFAEIVRATIQGIGEDFRMILRVNGTVPDDVPDDKTHWIIAFGLTGTNEDEGYSFGAQLTQEGWQAYAGGAEGGEGFPGTFLTEGDEIIMTVPWSYIRGPREFEWYAASNWFRSLANQTHYSVDLAPNKDLAKFPN
ncbi:MAG: hypothetical protein M3277_08775 [Actinomycetota bacterium]|nr:hypothetical protein [Actinomycetota bacterium]